jgi:hypothetical protein
VPSLPTVDAGFELAPTGPSLCGFGIPGFSFNISFALPPLDIPPDLSFLIGLALQCDLSDPLDVSFGPGGGRKPTGDDPDLDPDY